MEIVNTELPAIQACDSKCDLGEKGEIVCICWDEWAKVTTPHKGPKEKGFLKVQGWDLKIGSQHTFSPCPQYVICLRTLINCDFCGQLIIWYKQKTMTQCKLVNFISKGREDTKITKALTEFCFLQQNRSRPTVGPLMTLPTSTCWTCPFLPPTPCTPVFPALTRGLMDKGPFVLGQREQRWAPDQRERGEWGPVGASPGPLPVLPCRAVVKLSSDWSPSLWLWVSPY